MIRDAAVYLPRKVINELRLIVRAINACGADESRLKDDLSVAAKVDTLVESIVTKHIKKAYPEVSGLAKMKEDTDRKVLKQLIERMNDAAKNIEETN